MHGRNYDVRNYDVRAFSSREYYKCNPADEGKFSQNRVNKSFMDSVKRAEDRTDGTQRETESWEEKLKKFDEEMQRIEDENKRVEKRLQEERIRKKRIQKKLLQKLAFKKYLARQDEILQLNEKISLERAVGEDVYIEKPPLSKSLSVTEIMAICSET